MASPPPLRRLLPLLVLAFLAPMAGAEAPKRSPQGGEKEASKAAAAPAPRPGADWLARAQRHLAKREYEAGPNAQGLQAPNRAQNLRTYFESTGIRVVDRTAAGSPELLTLRLAGIGRGEQLAPVDAGEVTSEGARVTLRRPQLAEWYVNSAAGLEQGFSLTARPAGDGPLLVALAVGQARAALWGERVVLQTPTGRRLEYGHLFAFDANGDPVEARFDVAEPGHVRLVVDDRGASYPLHIDPLLTAAADTRLESNQADAELGTSVAGAGDVDGDGYADVIVGAPGYDDGESNEGAAFVFLGSASGVADGSPATAAAKLQSNQAEAGLGTSVAGAGDVDGDGYADVIVGAPGYDDGESNEGAAFVFLGSASGVADGNPTSAAAKLQSNQADAGLGQSVAGAGDVDADGYADVIVGAPGYDDVETDEGAAFIFLGSASGVASGNPSTAATQLESNQAGAGLGESVAGAGDVDGDTFSDVVVGAPGYDADETEEGAAFVFLGSLSGIADGNPATAATQLESNQASAGLGGSVSGAGDVDGDGYADVIVGARYYDPGVRWGVGAAFVFLGAASGIADGNPSTAAAELKSSSDNTSFGASVAGLGDVNGDGYADVVVGAPEYDAGESFEGAAFVFLGSAAGIGDGSPATAAARLEANQADAELGGSVAGAGDVDGDGYADVIVGARYYDATETNEGAAFIFLGGAAAIPDANPASAAAKLQANQAGAWLGTSVAGAGDVDGDGYADVIVGAPAYDGGEADEGAAFVFLGSAAGIPDGDPLTAATQIESNQAGAWLGWSVAGAGDINGDGYGDVIVGASDYAAGEAHEGAAFVFLGGASGIPDGDPTTAAARLESNQAYAYLGWSVAGAGDINGDGYGDVIVGAPTYSAGQSDEGTAFVFMGTSFGLANGNPANAATWLESDQAGAWMGISVAGAGDVDGDGYADVIVGASDYDAGETDEGTAFVFLGGPEGIPSGNPSSASARLESNQADAYMGWSVAGAGDVDGDGYGDVIVGASDYDDVETDEGAAFVFLGSVSGIANGNPSTAAAQLEADQDYAWLGMSVAGAGDVNGDGYADVIVGASGYDAGKPDEGAAFVFLGSPTGIPSGNPASAAAQLTSSQADASLGMSVAGAGDVNGDGFADVIVGATDYDDVETDEGAAFVFLGNAGAHGRWVLARQIQGDGSSDPVEPWGGSYALDRFKVEMVATHPMGRGRVKVEAEVCPPGVPLGDPSCQSHLTPTWIDVTATPGGVLLSETLSGLAPGTLYRWRARVLYAPIGVTEAGITPPPNPAHGPWRRVSAQAREADLRVVPEPGELLLLGTGIAFLALIGRRRMRA